jgi:hypothetical protein
MKTRPAVFWDITSCSSEKARCFGGTYHPHLQGRRVKQARYQQKRWPFSEIQDFTTHKTIIFIYACLLLGLLFDPEDRGVILLRNVRLPPNYTVLQPRRSYFPFSVPSYTNSLNILKPSGYYMYHLLQYSSS